MRFIKDILDIKNVLGKYQTFTLKIITGTSGTAFYGFTCVGDMILKYIDGGVENIETYTDYSGTLSFGYDSNTNITVEGFLTEFTRYGGRIEEADFGGMKTIENIQLSGSSQLQKLNVSGCTNLQTLNLSSCLSLYDLNIENCSLISVIYYAANNEDVSTAIADAISNSDVNNGTLYTNSAGTYYSIIAAAAIAKGWTIANI